MSSLLLVMKLVGFTAFVILSQAYAAPSFPCRNSDTGYSNVASLKPNKRNAQAAAPSDITAGQVSPTPDFNFASQPMFNASGNWTTAIPCSFDASSKLSGPSAWELAEATDAWTQLMAAWNLPSRPAAFATPSKGNLTFSQFIWHVFHQHPGVNCDAINDQVCSDTISCGDGSPGIPPAGYLIVNSMIWLNKIFSAQNNALDAAYGNMNSQMITVATTFAPQSLRVKQEETAEAILGAFETALGIVSAGAISSAFKAMKIFENISEKSIEHIHDIAEKAVSIASTLLEKLPAPQTDEDTSVILTTLLGKFYDHLKAAQPGYLRQLAGGLDIEDQQSLTSLMNTGLLLNLAYPEANFSDHLSLLAQQTLYGTIIPTAWAISPVPVNPFILRIDKSQHPCNDSSNPWKDDLYMSADTASKTRWCDPDGNSWFLLNGVRSICRNCDKIFPFQALPGGDSETLDGSNFAGITLADIFTSSWGGFVQNGKRNGYTLQVNTSLSISDDLTISGGDGLPMEAGIRTPGFFNYTICLDPKEAFHNIELNISPVCGTQPSVANANGGINEPGTYTPGYCKVHVTQFQRREGNENPLNNYQLQVTIFDNANLIVGDATKQNAADPLIIVDSVLPYDLIVAAQGAKDDDPIFFWYADQWWGSNDQDHHCAFGVYDSGKREGDCGFSCPLPDANPPASATVTMPIPASATDAIGGTLTFTNTFITSSPTSVVPPAPTTTGPPPPPTPTYATGWCGLHVVQYQKHEQNVNPTGDYDIEVTIFDSNKVAIGSSGKVAAPTDQAVTVTGLISPLTVTAHNTDDQPLSFAFAGHTWDSGSCSVGDYDNGDRNMDCGFSC